MKTAASLLMVILLLLHDPCKGQGVTLSKKKASLENIFYEIQKQTGYNFFYPDEWVTDKNNITINVRNEPVEKVLEWCLKGLPFTYKITGTSIVLSRRTSAEKNDPETGDNSFTDVTGEIRNEKGELLEGITVAVSSVAVSRATATDNAGKFRLTSIPSNSILYITGTSIEPYRVQLDGKATLMLTVNTRVNTIEEVVVSTGYQDIPKERATGSFVKISNELYNRKTGPQVLDRLDGISNGVLFDKRNPTPNIQIRGLFTLTESISQPLIIVDNFPYEGNINNLNTNDVESVTILKDASATSIWGARAGNGVIVITTKKGSFNQPMRISVNSNLTVIQKVDLHKIPDVTTSDYIDFEKEMFDLGIYNTSIQDPLDPITPAVEIFAKERSGEITSAEAQRQIAILRGLDVRNEFEKYWYRNELIAQHSFNLRGGGKKIKYFFSAGYNKNREGLVGNDNNRLTLRSDNTFLPVKNLQVRVGISYTNTHSNMNNPAPYSQFRVGNKKLPLYSRLIDENGDPAAIAINYKSSFTDTVGAGKLFDWKFRPLQELEVSQQRYDTDALLLDLNLKYDFTPSLAGEIKYQYQGTKDIFNSNQGPESYFTRDLVNDYTQINGDVVTYPIPYGNIVRTSNSKLNYQSARAQLNFGHLWNSNYELNMLGGAEIREVKTANYESVSYAGEVNDTVRYRLVSSGNSSVIPSASEDNISSGNNRFVSLFVNASFKILDRYTVSASARKDASNLFGVSTNQRTIPLWSVGTAWKISKENFYKSDLIPYLNLRMTYGFSGNINNTISARTTISRRPDAGYMNLPVAAIANAPNADLRWEKIGQFNIGLDMNSKNSRINGSLEFFYKKATDVIGAKALDPTVGIGTLFTNSANVQGSGFDLQLNTLNVKAGSFRWNSNFVFNEVNYKVTRFLFDNVSNGFTSGGQEITPITGYNPYLVVSYRWAGLDPMSGDPRGYVNGVISKDYDEITSSTPFEDQYKSGPALPRYFGNLTNIFSWKQFSISANMLYKLGYFFRRPTVSYISLASSVNIHPDYLKRWKKPGDELFTNIPSAVFPLASLSRSDFYTFSEVTVVPGDHVRLNDIRIDYVFDKISNKNIPFKNIQLYAYINNLNILIWKKNNIGIDPDFPAGSKSLVSFTTGILLDL